MAQGLSVDTAQDQSAPGEHPYQFGPNKSLTRPPRTSRRFVPRRSREAEDDRGNRRLHQSRIGKCVTGRREEELLQIFSRPLSQPTDSVSATKRWTAMPIVEKTRSNSRRSHYQQLDWLMLQLALRAEILSRCEGSRAVVTQLH